MRIAWCTPFTVRSAIGGISAIVVEALRRYEHVDVDIWYPEGTGGRTWPDRGQPFGGDPAGQLAEYDAVVYNMGDHAEYHGPILDLSHMLPGLVVLHDLSLVHLVSNRLVAVDDDYFISVMQRWYGPRGRRAALEALEARGDWAWRAETVQQFPLTEMALESATGVITHSRYAADALAHRYVGDVTVLPLPVDGPGEPEEVAHPALPDDRLVVLQAGVLNPNKHVSVVLDAIAEAELGDRVHLVVCGHARPRELEELRQQITALGLTDSTTVLGEVSDATLHALRLRADVATILRHPCGEAASAVLAESLAYGLPVVSVDDGCYREAPAEAVIRVPVPPRAAEVGAALRRWADDPELRAAASHHARSFVSQHHSARAYARGVVDALARSGSARRRVAVAHQLSTIAAQVGFTPGASLNERLAGRAHELFGGAPRCLPATMPREELSG
jgi:glycosyltransferase involved in cell wall biosynthesis